MSYTTPPRARARRSRATIVAALLAVSAVLLGGVASRPTPVHNAAHSTADQRPPAIDIDPDQPALQPPAGKPDRGRRDRPGRPNPPISPRVAAGVHDSMPVIQGETPAVANLDPALLNALRQAAADAARAGIEFDVNSGWRSAEHQEQLLRDAIAEYGSEQEASRWVATPKTSAHVSGDAVDIGPSSATAWLSVHGFNYGLCQIYRNEPWHYELRPEAPSRGCPRMYDDPTHDPRMQR